MSHFKPSKFYVYGGPSYYLPRQAVVFNLTIAPDSLDAGPFIPAVLEVFPALREKPYERTVDIFVDVLMETLRMDIKLYLSNFYQGRDGDDHVIAVEYLDDKVAEDCVHAICEWFNAIKNGIFYNFGKEFVRLQGEFDKTFFGGPTFYSIYEAALKREVPVHYLFEENQFQFGYGRKQIRGRSTTVSTDGIKDTEFTMYKDMVGEFLDMCGFPTPKGSTCFSEEDLVEASKELKSPVVVKPVSGHKGQGVTTGIRSEKDVREAFQKLFKTDEDMEGLDDGVLVQEQVEGTDHRLLSVKGKFVAALQRVPAYVDGNGTDTIKTLIGRENDTIVRLDNARSPLCKIKIDDDLLDFLKKQDLSIESVPGDGERITLRRVANISAGGVSINVTDKIHPANMKLVEDISSFFNVACMGIDVLCDDIANPWTGGNFGIIEINAGPGVFMHLAPAIGGAIDVPAKIIDAHFPGEHFERVPIIAGNALTTDLCRSIYGKLKELRADVVFGSLTDEGVHFNGEYFFRNGRHDQNVKIVLRRQDLDFAAFNHTKEDIWDFGLFHQGADVVVLENPGDAEEAILRDLLPDGHLVVVRNDSVAVLQDGKEVASYPIEEGKEEAILKAIEPLLPELLKKYD